MRHSIRRRLPLSYAAIALLAALALGAVLLLILRSYYQRVEREYLHSNAQAIGVSLAQLLEEDAPLEVLQAQLDTSSLLSEARVQLFDAEGQWVASSDRTGPRRLPFARLPATLLGLSAEERRQLLDRLLSPFYTWPEGEVPGTPPPAPATPTGTLPNAEGRATPAPTRRERIIALERGFPLGLVTVRGGSDVYSSQVAMVPIFDSEQKLLGFVELSQGPAYAREIVTDVAWGWGIASAVAVVVAGLVGWRISQRISSPLLDLTRVTASMADGDLAARADVARQDELGTLAHSFNQMAGRVEEIVITLRRFASDAAHEIHTPLTALRTNLELAREDVLEGNDEHLLLAQAQLERLEALTAGLLDLSRIEAGSQSQSFVAVPLVPLIGELGEVYASRAEQAGVQFDLSLPGTAVTARGDEGQLRRAVANLLDNAIKFTPEGGSVRLGLKQEGTMAVCWVEDTGIGIAEADLPHLFQRFHRGRNASPYPGSGLGLAIVKAIVDRHSGQIQAESTGQGASFTLRIPLS